MTRYDLYSNIVSSQACERQDYEWLNEFFSSRSIDTDRKQEYASEGLLMNAMFKK